MQANGISLHIGINFVDPVHYQGWDGELNACEADAEDLKVIAENRGFNADILLTAQATRKKVIDSITDAANNLSSGDIFFLSYSGHGSQLPNLKEAGDGLDETWCLYDAQLIDNELYNLLGLFKIGVRVLVFSDSCHSGTVAKHDTARPQEFETKMTSVNDDETRYRNMPENDARNVYCANQSFYDSILEDDSLAGTRNQVHASVLLLSGCLDKQLSRETTFHGLFTGRLLKVWRDGSFAGDYKQFHADILKGMPSDQTPNYCTVGAANPAFEGQVPFTISL